MTRLLAVLWLTALWALLWRDASPVNLAGGFVLAAALVAVRGRGEPETFTIRPLASLRFLAVFAYKLVEANVVLAREVVTPQNRIETGIIAVPLAGCTDMVVALAGNAVSLTPGTLTIEVGSDPEPVLYVHVLHLHDLDRARRDVLEIAALVRAAFQPGAAATTTSPEVAP